MAISNKFGRVCGLVFGVWGLVFGVWCLVFGVWDLVFGVWDLWFRVQFCTRPAESVVFRFRLNAQFALFREGRSHEEEA